MLPTDFLKTIYVGDRACKAILIYSWEKLVKIQVDEISRIRNSSGKWDFYNEENIKNGFLVFEEVQSLRLKPEGYLPNDFINDIEIHELDSGKYYEFIISVGSVDGNAKTTEVEVRIIASSLRLEGEDGKAVWN